MSIPLLQEVKSMPAILKLKNKGQKNFEDLALICDRISQYSAFKIKRYLYTGFLYDFVNARGVCTAPVLL